MSGSIPVPGEFFENHLPAPDEVDDYGDDTYRYDGHENEDGEWVPAPAPEPVPREPLSEAIRLLRLFAAELRHERHPRAHWPAEIANMLIEVRAPTPEPSGPRAEEDSPTGNCERCGAALPLPSMGRGKPRKLCLKCSPPRPRRK